MKKKPRSEATIPETKRLNKEEAERRLNECLSITGPVGVLDCSAPLCLEARAFLAGREEGREEGFEAGRDYEADIQDPSCCCGGCA